ncbi:nucleotidyl transferase AbiEii/AbiGii toxin family protein [Streptomyces sp. NPDC051976]|uniref:nucleotidyl transferase AbiEii/AbiGii toxin family protein n=1 Tax=Streptomyces sp. NPDC051976 TaxID=3154947 RepID=UPI003435DEC1
MSDKTYTTPAALRAALRQAAQTMSKQHGMPVAQLQDIWYFNRLAARVFIAEPDDWLIKGGQALLVRYAGAARLSRDIDLQSASPDRTAEQARQALLTAAAMDLGDFLSFTPTRFDAHSDGDRGGAQHFDVALGPTQAAHIKVDLVVGRNLMGIPEVRELTPPVAVEWPSDWPMVRLYPVLDHIADKICAMYERHGENGKFASNRYRDLADLLLLTQQETVQAAAARDAIRREANRRTATGIPVQLPPRFEAPAPDWPTGYPQQATLVLGLNGCRTYEEAARAAGAFLDPLLDGSATGCWQPDRATWE